MVADYVGSLQCQGVKPIRLGLASLLLLASPFVWAHDYFVRSEVVVDNEIRLLVETMKITGGFIVGHSSTASQAKIWLVIIPIHANPAGDQATKPYVIGPLWEVDDRRSEMSARDHVDFNAADRKATRAEPFVGFGEGGEVLRIQWNSEEKPGEISRLVWTRKSAHWVPAGNYDQPEGLGRFNRMEVGSGPLTLAWPDPAKPILFETITGKLMDDPWLTATFRNYGMSKWIDYAIYGFLSITDDRKYIVTFPSDYLNPDGSKWVYSATGPWPTRKAPATYYQRDHSAGVRFEQQHVSHGFPWDSGPVYAVTIDGELRILSWTPEFLYLDPPGDGDSIKVANPGMAWNNLIRTRHQASRRRFFFFDEGFDAKGNKYFAMIEWDYGAQIISKTLIDPEAILRIKWGAPSPQGQVKIEGN